MVLADLHAGYASLMKLLQRDLPSKVAYKVCRLYERWTIHYSFYVMEHNKLLEKFAETTDGKTYVFADEDKRKAYLDAKAELDSISVDEELPEVEIALDDSLKLSAKEIADLSFIITFKEG